MIQAGMQRVAGAILAALIGAIGAMLLLAPTPALAAVATVVNGDDDGPGSFRQAVADASANGAIRQIVFARGLTVQLDTPVVYTGSQDLGIIGRDSTISGAGVAQAATWDGGLFVSSSAADIALRNLDFVDSFNNGVAVFIPAAATGTVEVTLDRVSIERATYHGLFVDGQAFDGFNTDDEPHATCVDPHFVDSSAGIRLTVLNTTIADNGQIPGGFDDSLATGCPRDFDGIRVDDGGDGGIDARFVRADVHGNLADGVELDEVGSGDVRAQVLNSSFNENGNSGETIDGLEDPDDGFDIDEAGAGDIVANFVNSEASGNLDEGLDLDEAGTGNVRLTTTRVTANTNEDEGIKADEEDEGSLDFRAVRTTAANSASQDGIEMTEVDDGDLDVRITNSNATGNDNSGVKVTQEDAGVGALKVVNSDLSGNGDGAVDDSDGGVTVTLVNVTE